MNYKKQILCPEYVPLENKGEEAIIRGTIDILNIDCEYHIVDNNSKVYYQKDNLHVHPGSLFFSDWRTREFELGFSFEQIYSSICSLIRNGLNKFFPFWIRKPHRQAVLLRKYISNEKKPPSRYNESIELLKKIDYVIAGHNGGLDEYVCHILNELDKINIPYGIFGSSMKPNYKGKHLLNVFEKTFKKSDFNIARNPIGFRWAITNFPNCDFELQPDPAFGMIPESSDNINELLVRLELKDFLKTSTIMITTAEPAPITRHSFNSEIGTANKINAHRKFLSELLKLILDNTESNVLFLPHTIGPSIRMDDRLISSDVVNKAGATENTRVKVLRADLSAKELKGIINLANFLVAERVHSIIGAIGVRTPFICLASTKDTRVQGIIKEQMGLGDQVYFLDDADPLEAFGLFKKMILDRESIINQLEKINITIESSFNVISSRLNLMITQEK